MNTEKFRITCRIRTVYGTEKTVTFKGNVFTMKKILRESFKAVSYQVRKMGTLTFAASMPWESVDDETEVTKNAE